MNKILQLSVILLFLYFPVCNGGDCDKLPKHYSSYQSAVAKIKGTHFKIQESVNTSKSSWIRGASFFSCDGKTGFFIITSDKQEYLYSGVPKEIWEGFKSADSFGSYYDHNIKNKFVFKL